MGATPRSITSLKMKDKEKEKEERVLILLTALSAWGESGWLRGSFSGCCSSDL